ncbi:MAG TPA: APC family permease [Kofleriaceae bacterium]|nr:APC family permease [Kofleriaceae bacterium]
MPDVPAPRPEPGTGALARVLDLRSAVLLGLGSIVGTGVFVSLGLAAGVAGSAVLLAVVLAALLATANGLSSAQLAAAHPTSGGTYEYAYRYLNRPLALVAGVTFLVAKSASAATAALGVAGYMLSALDVEPTRLPRTAVAVAAITALTAIVAGGMRRSSRANAIIVGVTLAGLAALVVAALPAMLAHPDRLAPRFDDDTDLLHATALVFVAFTGYGRVATLGEEVRDPTRTIPRAVLLSLAVAAALYVAVTAAALATLGASGLTAATRATSAPLEAAARASALPSLHWAIGAAAITAMLGVILNLLLGLSRVVLAMARRRDLPSALAGVDERATSPRAAVFAVGAVVAALALLGDVKLTWTLSAVTVLVYYAVTNLAALRLPARDRRFPRAIAVAGLVTCAGLAGWALAPLG